MAKAPKIPNIPVIVTDDPNYKAAGKLTGKVALVTGGDSGIGKATAIAFAKEGADVAIVFRKSVEDARDTVKAIEKYGRRGLAIQADLQSKKAAQAAINEVIDHFTTLNIVVNNAGTQTPQTNIEDISEEQLEVTFRTNIFSMFYVTQAAMPYLQADDTIINTTSVTAYRGSEELLDYSSTKGAITSFTRSLAKNLAKKQVRVNAVAPGPIWTDLVISSFNSEKLASFGKFQPLGRAGQPYELAPAYVYFASNDSSYVTGQVLHVNGGEIVNA